MNKKLLVVAALSASAVVAGVLFGMQRPGETTEVKKAEIMLTKTQQEAKEKAAECAMRKEAGESKISIHEACHDADKAKVAEKHAREKLATAKKHAKEKCDLAKKQADAKAKKELAVAKP